MKTVKKDQTARLDRFAFSFWAKERSFIRRVIHECEKVFSEVIPGWQGMVIV